MLGVVVWKRAEMDVPGSEHGNEDAVLVALEMERFFQS